LLEFKNFCWYFIRNYSYLVKSLTEFTKKYITFVWLPTYQESFDIYKSEFILALVIQYFNSNIYMIETDASDYIFSRILSQHDSEDILHFVAYFSNKHLPINYNHRIYNKELLAIIHTCKE
jgi:hypothetical protein